MNGYFVRQDILEKLDQLEELKAIMKGLESKPEQYKDMTVEELGEMVQTCQDTIEALDFELEELAESLAGDALNARMEAKAYKEEAERWQNKRYKAELRERADKDLLMWVMKKHGKLKMDAGKFKLTIANNGGKTPIIFNADPEDLPARFRQRQVVFKADDAAIREYLDAGKTSKYFEYGERGTNLRIK